MHNIIASACQACVKNDLATYPHSLGQELSVDKRKFQQNERDQIKNLHLTRSLVTDNPCFTHKQQISLS